ncbi:MAG: DUF1553 domain-containing protein, partial [Planctomycetales bacterium]
GSSRADGLKIFVNGRQAECDVIRDKLTKTISKKGGDKIILGERHRDRGFTNGMLDEFRLFDRQLTLLEVAKLYMGDRLDDFLSQPVGTLAREDAAAIEEYYLETQDPVYRERLAALQTVRQQRCDALDEIKEIMVMQDLTERRPTFLLKRGRYDAPAEPVEPDTPGVFPPLADGQKRNRLALAHWLVDPQHPLTARVAVNRIWQMCFGQGLVWTPEDFGSQGSPPTHPLLLDWLATDFVKSGWDMKRLIRQIVMSATYRQRSGATTEQTRNDPENVWLARGPRYRLPAEMLRDNALAVSGLLVDTVGGPSAKPYEVAESFKPVEIDKEQGLYRRSLYTFWKRTAPAPVMMVLDAAKRDVCSLHRERTSSPLQVFVLMNDPQFVEAARVLGQKMLEKYGDDVPAMIEEIFRTLTGRLPEQSERQIIAKMYHEQLEYFKNSPEKTKRYLEIGRAEYDQDLAAPKLAAAGVLVNVLLNHDE